MPVLEVPGFEADDVLGTVVDRARAHDLDVVLVTQDKDMLQLVGPRVTVLAPGARAGEQIVYDADKVREKWGVGPEQIPDLLALMGDSIDNIPGVPGVGQKTAVKLIGQFGSVERPLPASLARARQAARDARRQPQAGAALARARHREHARAAGRRPRGAPARASPTGSGCARCGPSSSCATCCASCRTRPGRGAGRRGRDAARRARRSWRPSSPRCRTGEPIAVDWAEEGGPPDPVVDARRVCTIPPPATSRCWRRSSHLSPPGERVTAALGGRRLVGHDVKHLLEWWLARGGAAAGDRGHRGGRLPPQSRALQLQARGGRATSTWARTRGRAGRARARAWCGPCGSRRRASCARRRFARSTTRSSGRSCPCSRSWSGTASARIPTGSPSSRKELDSSLEGLTREIYTLAGEEFNLGSPKQLAAILFEKLGLPPVQEDQDRLLDRRRRAGAARRRARAARQAHRAPHAVQAQVHLRRRAAGDDQSGDGAHPHVVQPDGRSEGVG